MMKCFFFKQRLNYSVSVQKHLNPTNLRPNRRLIEPDPLADTAEKID